MSDIQCIGIYIGIWAALLLYTIYRSRSFGLGASLLLTYLVSSVFSLLFYETRILFQVIDINLSALLYFQFCSLIIILPYIYYSKDLSVISISTYPKIGKLYGILRFMLPFVAFVTIECIYGALTTNASSLSDVYETSYDSGGKEHVGYSLSWISQHIYHFIGRLYYLWPIILFECLRYGGKMRKMAIVPFLCILSIILMSYISAARVGIVRIIMLVTIVFYFYRNSLDHVLLKKIIYFASIFGGLLVTLLAIISISRFTGMVNTDVTMLEWISLYFGEGVVRFSTYIWDLSRTSDGDTSFSLIKYFLGFDTFTDYYDRREFYEGYFGIPTNIFYTFVGDWYQDFGRYIAALMCCIVSILEFMILGRTCKKTEIGLGQVFVLGVISYFVMFGFMYYAFKTSAAQQQLLESSIALLLIINYVKK